jgi:UDP-glucose 4-epimerase
LADRLLVQGHQVMSIDNYATGQRGNLTPQENLAIVEGTIADGGLINRLFEEFRPEVVAHAAASYKDPKNWLEDVMTNTLGTANIVQTSQRLGVRRLIYFQTSLCYGLHPLEQPITLSHPVRPEGSSYAITKTAGEQYVQMSGLDYISFRLANAYGPRNISGPLPTFYHRLTTNKPCFVMDTRRDFIFIDDVVDLLVKAVCGKGRRGIYHIASGRDYAIKELFTAAVKALGLSLEEEVEVRDRNPDDAYTILLDPSKTIEDFDWSPSTPVEAGVRSAIEWYQEHGIDQTYTHLKPAGPRE